MKMQITENALLKLHFVTTINRLHTAKSAYKQQTVNKTK